MRPGGLPARPGDVIAVDGQHLGDHGHLGEVVEVLGEPGRQRFRVRWDDGRETIVYPGPDAHLRRRGPRI